MATNTRRWTIADYYALPEDGNRYEIIDGQLYINGVEAPGNELPTGPARVTPAPAWRHGNAVLRLAVPLDAYLTAHALGHVQVAPADVAPDSGDSDVVVQPDLFVVPLADGRPPLSWNEAGRLLLAVEVLSPSTARVDRTAKRRLYQRAGVPEYWIVDLDAQLIERWRPEDERPEILTDELVWQPDPAHPPLVIELPPYFARVHGD